MYHYSITQVRGYIPVPLEDARFRKCVRLIIKAHFFIKGYPQQKKTRLYFRVIDDSVTGSDEIARALLLALFFFFELLFAETTVLINSADCLVGL